MRIGLTQPGSGYRTDIDTEHDVTIRDVYRGPIFVHGDVRLAVFARDDRFEMNCWRSVVAEPGHGEVLPADAIQIAVSPDGVTLLNQATRQRGVYGLVEDGPVRWHPQEIPASRTPCEPNLGCADTEHLLRELIVRFQTHRDGDLGWQIAAHRITVLSELLGGLSATEREYRTVG